MRPCNDAGGSDISPIDPQSRPDVRADGGGHPPAGPIGPADRAWFESAYKASTKALWCIAAAIVKDRSLAHDIVQEAAVVAMGKMREFDRSTSFAAWAGQIVRFTALNELRRKGRAPRSGDDVLLSPGIGASSRGGESTNDSELRGQLAGALEKLDDTARACLLMRTVMGMPYQEIGAALGVPEGTAMSHVHRSRQALRSMLMPYWQGEDAAASTGKGAKR